MVLKYFTFKRQYHRKNIYVVVPFYGKKEQKTGNMVNGRVNEKSRKRTNLSCIVH